MRKLLFLLFALPLLAVDEYKYSTYEGSEKCYVGHTCWFRIIAYRSTYYPITAWTNDGTVVTATGSSAIADNLGVWLAVDSGSTFPSTINPMVPYFKCETSGDNFKLTSQMYDDQTTPCTTSTAQGLYTQYPTGHGASGTMYVVRPQTGVGGGVNSFIQLQDTTLPAGVTMGGTQGGVTYVVQCDAGSLYNPCGTNGGYPATGGGGNTPQPFRIPLVIDASATPGSSTLQFTLHCVSVNALCPGDQLVEIPFEILANPTIPIVHPSPVTPIDPTDLATINSRLTVGAAIYCDKSTGVIDWDPLSVFSVSNEQQIWYYDGGWAYRQLALYTGDTDWNRCADTIEQQYNSTVWRANVAQQQQRMFFEGAKNHVAASTSRDVTGQAFVIWSYSNTRFPAYYNGGYTSDFNMRPSAYSLLLYLNYAKIKGWNTFAKVQAANPTLALQMETAATMLGTNLLMQTTGQDHYSQMQTFFVGLATQALITYAEYRGDTFGYQRTMRILAHETDYLWNTLRGINTTYPGEITWKNAPSQWTSTGPSPSGQGKHCAGNCAGVGTLGNGTTQDTCRTAQSLQYMFIEPWAWMYWMTDDATYQTQFDALMKTVADTYASNSTGKVTSEMMRVIPALAWRRFGYQYMP